MTKSIWAGIIALAIVISCGIAEVAVLNRRYSELYDQCQTLMTSALDESLTEDEYAQFEDKWHNLRETSELLLPHLDVYELNLRVSEAQSYVKQKDFKSAHAQLTIILELLDYIPHLMIPNFRHIV